MIDYEAEKMAIIKIIDDVFIAEANGDLEGTIAAYSDDVIFQGPGMSQLEGIDAVKQWYVENLHLYAGIKGWSSKQEISVSGDMAYDYGASVLSTTGPDGPVENRGKYSCVWKKIDSEWKCIIIAFSSDSPP
jgi:ketosteroid isomerase-like protein